MRDDLKIQPILIRGKIVSGPPEIKVTFGNFKPDQPVNRKVEKTNDDGDEEKNDKT